MSEASTFPVRFRPATEQPTKPAGDSMPAALLYNQCDGYHLVFAHFTRQGEFLGFFEFASSVEWLPGTHFCAWTLLPDSAQLYEQFADKRPAA